MPVYLKVGVRLFRTAPKPLEGVAFLDLLDFFLLYNKLLHRTSDTVTLLTVKEVGAGSRKVVVDVMKKERRMKKRIGHTRIRTAGNDS